MSRHDTAGLGTKLFFVAALVGTVVAANASIDRWGIVPVGFGLVAPAGVYFAGLAFGLRDALHESAGQIWVIAAIAIGAITSYLISDAATIPGGHVSIATASGVAFLFSELADLAIYTPLRERSMVAAVIASNLVGAAIDSALFLWLAFGSIDNLLGQIVGKTYMTLLALPIVLGVRRRRSTARRIIVSGA